ncbi:MAG: aminotransferase class V-fold PLP-dependent enzyme [Candidatus Limnocylindrales bacterium]
MRTDLGWNLDPGWTFLNHGSFGACPEPVLAAQREWRDRLERQPVHFMDDVLPGALDDARERVAAFIGADPAGLAFVPNATTGVNAVLRSLPFAPGDELLTDDHEYNATINALRAVAERDGATVVVAPLPFPPLGEDEVIETLLAHATDRTRLLMVSHVTSPTALVLPIERLVAAFETRGIDALVDGAHAPGMLPLDLDPLGAAYYTGNGHKWLCGPKGSAFLWVRADRRAAIHPPVTSHGANDPRTDRSRFRLEFDWMGTADPTAALALPAAIEFMAGLDPGGWPAVMAANRALALEAGRRLSTALGGAATTPASMVGSMTSVVVPGLASDADGLALKCHLEADRIEVPVVPWPVRAGRADPDGPPGAVLLRVSAQRYNDTSDIDALVASLDRWRADPA